MDDFDVPFQEKFVDPGLDPDVDPDEPDDSEEAQKIMTSTEAQEAAGNLRKFFKKTACWNCPFGGVEKDSIHSTEPSRCKLHGTGGPLTWGKKDEIVKPKNEQYPQDAEENEYRYLSPAWINELTKGLTAGAVKHPGATWRQIPAKEHAWRAVRHLIMWLAGDHSEPHLVNAGMRVMMAWEVDHEDDRRDQG